MNVRILAIVGGIVVAAIAVGLGLAWIKGGEQPTRWIEQPAVVPGGGR